MVLRYFQVLTSNLGSISAHVSEVFEPLHAKATFSILPPLFRPKFQAVPFVVEPDVRVCTERTPNANKP